MDSDVFRGRLLHAFEDKGMTQAGLVRACESIDPDITINRSDISRYLSGQSTPRRKKLMLIARALDVSYRWLAGEDDLDYSPKVTYALACLCDAADGHDAHIYAPDNGNTHIVYVSRVREDAADQALLLFSTVGGILADDDDTELMHRAAKAISNGGMEREMMKRILGPDISRGQKKTIRRPAYD